MSTYLYKCSCGENFDVIKSMHDATRPENCPKCGEVGKRIFTAPMLNGTAVFMPQYVPSLGKSFNSKREMQYEVERRGLVEVGNDFGSGEKMQRSFDRERERVQDERWNKYDEHEKLAAIVKDGGKI